MALQGKRGLTTDPFNKVDRTITSVSLTNFDLKDNTDVVNPSFILNVPDASKTDMYTKTNMIYVDAFKRWYNVDNIEFSSANRIIYRCSCDVLKSFAADIKANSYYVSRQENTYNSDIGDAFAPTENRTITENVGYECGFPNNGYANPSYIVQTIGSLTGGSVGAHTYVMNATAFESFTAALFGVSWQTVFTPDIATNIINAFAVPIDTATLLAVCGGVTENPAVIVADQTVPTGGYKFSTTSKIVRLNTQTITVPRHFNDFRDYDVEYQIYVPYCGMLKANGADALASYGDTETEAGTYRVSTFLDITSGDVMQVWDRPAPTENESDAMKWIFKGNCAVTTPINGANYTGAKIGAGIGFIGMATSLYTGNMYGVANEFRNTFEGYRNRGSKPTNSYSGGAEHYSTAWRTSQIINITTHRASYVYPTNYAHTVGKPCDMTIAGSALSGFTKCENVQMTWSGSPAPTEQEIQQIKSLLESGVIF